MKPMIATVLMVSVIALAGCASAPQDDAALAEARDRYQQLANQPAVQSGAPSVLLEAEDALQAAAEAENAGEREHQLYLANQRMAIAQAIGERTRLESRISQLSEERDRLQLQRAQRQTAELESELAALETRRTDRGLLVTLGDVFFDTARASVKSGAANTLDTLAQFMRNNPDQQVVIEGHTDARGPAQYNQQLSEQRAQSVKQSLVARGVESERIMTRGYGESRPIASNQTPGGQQLNRRVEIVFPEMGG